MVAYVLAVVRCVIAFYDVNLMLQLKSLGCQKPATVINLGECANQIWSTFYSATLIQESTKALRCLDISREQHIDSKSAS